MSKEDDQSKQSETFRLKYTQFHCLPMHGYHIFNGDQVYKEPAVIVTKYDTSNVKFGIYIMGLQAL